MGGVLDELKRFDRALAFGDQLIAEQFTLSLQCLRLYINAAGTETNIYKKLGWRSAKTESNLERNESK